MEQSLYQIFEIEAEAEAIQQEADALEAKLGDLKEKEELFLAQSMEKAKERLAKKRAALEEQQAQYRAELNAETEAELAHLQAEWEAHHGEWVETLYRHAIQS